MGDIKKTTALSRSPEIGKPFRKFLRFKQKNELPGLETFFINGWKMSKTLFVMKLNDREGLIR
jgi:hypothetical protein